MSLTYNYTQFMADPLCNSSLNPLQFGYTALVNAQHFTISFDVRSLLVCLAVNMGIMSLANLVEVRMRIPFSTPPPPIYSYLHA